MPFWFVGDIAGRPRKGLVHAVSGEGFISGRGRECGCEKGRVQPNSDHPPTAKPEAAYFIAEGGRRTGILIIDMTDASDLPRIAEPWFLALNASIEATPAMIPEDLEKAAPAIEHAVKTFGQAIVDLQRDHEQGVDLLAVEDDEALDKAIGLARHVDAVEIATGGE
jgi:hypothetical protein